LLPGGVLLLEIYMPYDEAKGWPLWRKDARGSLPEPWPDGIDRPPEDGSESAMHDRLVAVDPLEQQSSKEMRMLQFKARQLVSDVIYPHTESWYFRNEMRALHEKAGLTVEREQGS
jgi:hypothetical protein